MPKKSADSGREVRPDLRMPELLAPAGGFTAGWYALESGADAVYLGLKSFSARRSARNFDLDELSRLKALAAGRGKRIYVAINTVIREEELAGLAGTLYDLEDLQVDGIIIQDYGLLSVLRKHFPRLAVHASTQMGVHNDAGVSFLEQQGVRRVILSRELSLVELGRIRRAHPHIELEVFIHGALCYGFSGLCLASGLTTGRSGNRGECAQLCRSWYELDNGPDERGSSASRSGYFFSCNDLCSGELVLKLAAIGIDGLKIEGRMKAPEYVRWVSLYYRGILDGLPRAQCELAREQSRLVFSREPSSGWLENPAGIDLLSPDFPGHRGVYIGQAERCAGDLFLVTPGLPLAVRDGLQFMPPGGNPGGAPVRPEAFAVAELRPDRAGSAGEKVFQTAAGARVWVRGGPLPTPGTAIMKISSHADNLPEPKPGAFQRFRTPLLISATVGRDGLRLEAPAYAAGLSRLYGDCRPDPSRVPRNLAGALSPFLAPPGDSRFSLEKLTVRNDSGLADDGIYINPSLLKRARRDFYSLLENHRAVLREQRMALIARSAPLQTHPQEQAGRLTLPARDKLVPSSFGFYLPTRAILDHPPIDLGAGPSKARLLPLFPVLFSEESYFRDTRQAVLAHLAEQPDEWLVLGLGNAAHLAFAVEFRDCARVAFFADYGLYIANTWTFDFLEKAIPRLLFAYPWIEEPDCLADASLPLAPYGSFAPPLFISRACIRRHSAVDDADDDEPCLGCPQSGGQPVRQAGRRYRLERMRIAGSCLNLLTAQTRA
jgi:U32 family peptidase